MKRELLSAREVAEALGCGQSTVWRWAKNGVLPPPKKIGALSRWPVEEIRRIANEGAPLKA